MTRLETALIKEDDELGYCENCSENVAIIRLMALLESPSESTAPNRFLIVLATC